MKHRTKGFSLIEILVVLLIIGITLTFTRLAFGDFGKKRRMIMAAEQFTSYVKLIQQQAILETGTLGIKLTSEGYQVLQFQEPDKWMAMPEKRVFRQQFFPAGMAYNLKKGIKKQGSPAIVINSSGDMTPFTLEFGSAITVTGDDSGTLHIVKSP